MPTGEGFGKDQYGAEELQRRVDILDQPDGAQPHPLRCIGKQHQRPAGQNPGKGQDQAGLQIPAKDRKRALATLKFYVGLG